MVGLSNQAEQPKKINQKCSTLKAKIEKLQKNFISFSHIELRESGIENQPLFSTQTRISAQL